MKIGTLYCLIYLQIRFAKWRKKSLYKDDLYFIKKDCTFENKNNRL